MAKHKKHASHADEQDKFKRRNADFKSLLTVERTQPFVMICPVCGIEVIGQAVAHQEHWAHDELHFSFGIVHHCPTIVKSQKEAYIAMYGPWLQDLPFYSSEQYERDYQRAIKVISEEE